MRPNPFKGYRFAPKVSLQAVCWYRRYGLSYRDVRDMLAERGTYADASTIFRWMQRFGPEMASRCRTKRNWRGLDWHVDETDIRVGGKWRYLWRALDQFGHLVDFRLIARRDANAARVFMRQAIAMAGLYYPQNVTTDKAWNYNKIIKERNHGVEWPDRLAHIDRKYLNNRIESDRAALKKLLRPMRGFKRLSCANAK